MDLAKPEIGAKIGRSASIWETRQCKPPLLQRSILQTKLARPNIPTNPNITKRPNDQPPEIPKCEDFGSTLTRFIVIQLHEKWRRPLEFGRLPQTKLC